MYCEYCIYTLLKTNLDNEFLEKEKLMNALARKEMFKKELALKYGR